MKVLKRGSRGEDVRMLQTFLGIKVDGSFGPATERALKDYQRSKGLEVDGICGPATWASFSKSNDNSNDNVIRYRNATIIKAKPEDIQIVVANKKFSQTTSKNIINGTYFWAGQPNGIIVDKGKILCNSASHAWRGYPQSVLYYDGAKIGVKRVKSASELGNVKWAIGGCGMITPYGYSPTKEGFNGVYVDVLRTTNKTVIGAKNGQIWLMVVPNISHGSLLNLLKELNLDMAVSLDGGGSSVMRANGKAVMTSSRVINNWVVVR